MTTLSFFLLFITAVVIAGGQFLFKEGTSALKNNLNFHPQDILSLKFIKDIFSIIFEPHIFFALIFYFASLFLWLKVLSGAELSFAYPLMIGLGVLITSALSILFFKETVSVYKILGTILLVSGFFAMYLGGR